MNELVGAIAAMTDGDSATLLNIEGHDIWSVKLTVGYTVSDWMRAAEPEFREYLLVLTTKTKNLNDANEDLSGRFFASEFTLDQVDGESIWGAEVFGLGAAFIFSGIGLSIGSEDQWKQVQIPLKHRWLDESCRWQEDSVVALNLSGLSQVEPLLRLIQDQIRQRVRENSCSTTRLFTVDDKTFYGCRFPIVSW